LQEQMRIPTLPTEKPKRRRGRKLLFILFLFFVAIMVVLFLRSPLSKIGDIEITGNELLPTEQIEQAAAVIPGDSFFAVSSGDVQERLTKLRMVKSADVSKRFPGKLLIKIQEQPRVAYQFTSNGKQEVVLADGSVAPMQGLVAMVDKPILTGWSDSDPNLVKLCQTLASLPSNLFYDVSEIKPDPTESFEDRIKLYLRDGFEVITTIEYLPEKMPYLSSFTQQLKDDGIKNGTLSMLVVDTHIPFTTLEEQASGAGQGGTKNDKGKGDKDTGKKE